VASAASAASGSGALALCCRPVALAPHTTRQYTPRARSPPRALTRTPARPRRPPATEYSYEDYEGYGDEDAAAGRAYGPGAGARLRALSTLAADRRERMQDTAREAAAAASAAAAAVSEAQAAEEGALGAGGAASGGAAAAAAAAVGGALPPMLPWEADAVESLVAVGSPEAQRAAALAALKRARQGDGGGGRAAAHWSPAAEAAYREAMLVEEVYLPPPPPLPPPPKPRAVDVRLR
jgi:hypothetical protein